MKILGNMTVVEAVLLFVTAVAFVAVCTLASNPAKAEGMYGYSSESTVTSIDRGHRKVHAIVERGHRKAKA